MQFTLKGPGDESPRSYSVSELLKIMVAHVNDKRDGSLVVADEANVVYVGRQGGAKRGRFGNPFSHDPRSTAPFKVRTRKEAVESFQRWIGEPGQVDLLADVQASLHRKVLLCHCQHQRSGTPSCHAEVLVRLANPDWAEAEAQELRSAPPRHLELTYPVQFEAWARDLKMLDAPKILVTGDRNFKAADVITASLREFGPGALVIEGEARGADELARDSALDMGAPVAGFPAQWEPKPSTPPSEIRTRRDGKRYVAAAGPRRNEQMLKALLTGTGPRQVLAYHDQLAQSRGTRHMVEIAWAAGIPIRLHNSQGEVQDYTPAEPGLPLPDALTA